MPTSSFFKTFIFDETALEKIKQSEQAPGKEVSDEVCNRLLDGKEKLAQFSFCTKKKGKTI